MHDRYRTSELIPGTKVITGKLYGIHQAVSRFKADINLATVTGIEGNRTTITDESGVELEFFNTYVRPEPVKQPQDRVLWGSPLPQGTSEQVLAFCKTYLENAPSTIGLFHIEVVFEGIAMASFVSDNHLVDAGVIGEMDTWLDEKLYPSNSQDVGNARFWERKVYLQLRTDPIVFDPRPSAIQQPIPDKDLAPWKPGDLVIAGDYSCTVKDGVTLVNPVEWTVVGNFPHRRDVGAFMPAQFHPHTPNDDRHPRTLGDGIGSIFKFEREETLALASLQPDEALVLSYATARGDGSCVLGQQGRLFLEWGDARDYVNAPGPGLWVCYDAHGWSDQSHEGEWDVGIEASWRPATEADLATYGHDVPSVNAEITDALDDVTLRKDQFEIQVALAEAVHAEETANAPST